MSNCSECNSKPMNINLTLGGGGHVVMKRAIWNTLAVGNSGVFSGMLANVGR